jgi:hypothetical protein
MFEALDMAVRQQKARQEVLSFRRAKSFVESFLKRCAEMPASHPPYLSPLCVIRRGDLSGQLMFHDARVMFVVLTVSHLPAADPPPHPPAGRLPRNMWRKSRRSCRTRTRLRVSYVKRQSGRAPLKIWRTATA